MICNIINRSYFLVAALCFMLSASAEATLPKRKEFYKDGLSEARKAREQQLALEKRQKEHLDILKLVHDLSGPGHSNAACPEVVKAFSLDHNFERVKEDIEAILNVPETLNSFTSLERDWFIYRVNSILRRANVSHFCLSKEEKQDPSEGKEKSFKPEHPSLTFTAQGKVAVLNIPSFKEGCYDSAKVAEVVEKILEEEREGLVIRLQNNPGGLVKNGLHFARFFGKDLKKEGSVDVLPSHRDRFLEANPDANFRDQRTLRELHRMIRTDSAGIDGTQSLERETKAPGILKLPIAILVNRRTGSMAEQIALDFRDLLGARLFGSKTRGGLLNCRTIQIADVIISYPDADVVGEEGYRPESIGVPSDFEVPDDQALGAAERYLLGQSRSWPRIQSMIKAGIVAGIVPTIGVLGWLYASCYQPNALK